MGQEMDVTLAVFRAQMRFLAEHREVVTLQEGVLRASSPLRPLRRDLVAITFDDGYREVYTRAWPVVREFGLPATLFLATGFVEGTEPPPLRPGAGERGDVPRPVTWAQVDEMRDSGLVAVGSHSRTHRNFDRLTHDEALEECASSRELLERRLGGPVATFAYPRGAVAHEDVVGMHYRIGVGADGAKNLPSSLAPLRLSRVAVRASDGMFFFRTRLAGIAPLEDRLYDRLRAVRG
jgi:peptidoglycan/xylan/chitin deacetylase (PgdA/CDA1 family)